MARAAGTRPVTAAGAVAEDSDQADNGRTELIH